MSRRAAGPLQARRGVGRVYLCTGEQGGVVGMGAAKGSRYLSYPIKQPAPAPAPASMRIHMCIHKQAGGTGGRRFGTARRAQTPATDDDMHTHPPRPARAAAPKPAPVLSSLQLCKPPTQPTQATKPSQSIHPPTPPPPPPSTLAYLSTYPLSSTVHCPLPTAHCPLPTA
jgi:hypothetical protein